MTQVYDVFDIFIGFGWWRVRSPYCLKDPEGEWESTLMELEGETKKRLDISNGSNNMEAVVMAAVRNGLGGDGGNEITSTEAAQAGTVIRRQHKRDKIVIRRRKK